MAMSTSDNAILASTTNNAHHQYYDLVDLPLKSEYRWKPSLIAFWKLTIPDPHSHLLSSILILAAQSSNSDITVHKSSASSGITEEGVWTAGSTKG